MVSSGSGSGHPRPQMSVTLVRLMAFACVGSLLACIWHDPGTVSFVFAAFVLPAASLSLILSFLYRGMSSRCKRNTRLRGVAAWLTKLLPVKLLMQVMALLCALLLAPAALLVFVTLKLSGWSREGAYSGDQSDRVPKSPVGQDVGKVFTEFISAYSLIIKSVSGDGPEGDDDRGSRSRGDSHQN